MPAIQVRIYREDEGTIPLMEWLDEIKPKKARAKCLAAMDLLEALGFELRRPHADLLRDEIYELRIHWGSVQYRILYFYHGQAAVLSHGFIKRKAKVPDDEIDLAVERKMKHRANPEKHSVEEEP